MAFSYNALLTNARYISLWRRSCCLTRELVAIGLVGITVARGVLDDFRGASVVAFLFAKLSREGILADKSW
jgi:hypothetical protein